MGIASPLPMLVQLYKGSKQSKHILVGLPNDPKTVEEILNPAMEHMQDLARSDEREGLLPLGYVKHLVGPSKVEINWRNGVMSQWDGTDDEVEATTLTDSNVSLNFLRAATRIRMGREPLVRIEISENPPLVGRKKDKQPKFYNLSPDREAVYSDEI